jgi:hypothetical protein
MTPTITAASETTAELRAFTGRLDSDMVYEPPQFRDAVLGHGNGPADW